MEQLFDTVKTYQWGQNRTALTELGKAITDAHDSPAKLREIEKGLIGVLQSDATDAGKDFICRQLSMIGTEQSVPALVQLLTDEKCSDIARYALERMPDSAVDEALRSVLPKTSGKMKVGILNTLGERRDDKAAAALSRLIGDSDEMIACAAAAALGKIGGTEATEALAKARNNSTGNLRAAVLDAYLKCADKMAAEGKKSEANTIYKELYNPQMPANIRAAAMRGMIGKYGNIE